MAFADVDLVVGIVGVWDDLGEWEIGDLFVVQCDIVQNIFQDLIPKLAHLFGYYCYGDLRHNIIILIISY